MAGLVYRVASSEVYALDSSIGRIESIQKKYPALKTCVSNSDSIPYPDGFFDKAYATLAVHHFPDQPKSFREFARILKPGGILVIAELSPQTPLGRINRLWENGFLRYHLRFLGLHELIHLLEETNQFEVIESTLQGSAYFLRALRTNVNL